MSREELRDLAALDALGLLDEFEAALFTRSFHHAPASVQDEIRELQAEIVADMSLLPEEEPDAALRARVLGAVGRAMEDEAHDLAPLATIGRTRNGESASAWSPRLGLTGQFWRAAAFALAAGVVICLYFLAQVNQKAYEISIAALNRQTEDQLRSLIGPGMMEFVARDIPVRVLHAPDGQPASAAGLIWVDESTDQAFLAVMNLADDAESLTVRVRDESGITTLASFTPSTTGYSAFQLDRIPGTRLARSVIEVVNAAGAVVLTTA